MLIANYLDGIIGTIYSNWKLSFTKIYLQVYVYSTVKYLHTKLRRPMYKLVAEIRLSLFRDFSLILRHLRKEDKATI